MIDEVGLAEESPDNSVKVFHNYLGVVEYPIVLISNHKLDSSKMSRVLLCSIPEMDIEDMKETGFMMLEDPERLFEGSMRVLRRMVEILARSHSRFL